MAQLTKNNVLDKVITTILLFAFASAGYPLVNTYIGYLAGNLTGWALIGLFTVGGIIGLVLMIGLFYGTYKIWMPGK